MTTTMTGSTAMQAAWAACGQLKTKADGTPAERQPPPTGAERKPPAVERVHGAIRRLLSNKRAVQMAMPGTDGAITVRGVQLLRDEAIVIANATGNLQILAKQIVAMEENEMTVVVGGTFIGQVLVASRDAGPGLNGKRLCPFGRNMGRPVKDGMALEVLSCVEGMLQEHEAVSVSLPMRQASVVIGSASALGTQRIALWHGNIPMLIDDSQIGGIRIAQENLVIMGRSPGSVMTIRPYAHIRTARMDAAESAADDVGWFYDAVEELGEATGREECVWVHAEGGSGEPQRYRWMEYDDERDRLELVVGRLDMQTRVVLSTQRLRELKMGRKELQLQGEDGATIRLWVAPKSAPTGAAWKKSVAGVDKPRKATAEAPCVEAAR